MSTIAVATDSPEEPPEPIAPVDGAAVDASWTVLDPGRNRFTANGPGTAT